MSSSENGSRAAQDGSKISGVVVGIVTDNQDRQGMARVKVRFPWRDDQDNSYWARIASLMGGKDRGTYFLPEVDDEVLVAFDHGDVHHPYIVGALWNGEDSPPETNSDGKNDIRKIKSRSGHEIIFNDDNETGGEKLEIRTNAGHKILLDDSSGGEKIEITDKSGSNAVAIDSVQNAISVKSGMKVSIESQMIEIKAGGMMNIEASGTLTLKGAVVMIN